MRKMIGMGAGLALAAMSHGASAGVVTDYRDNFQAGTPATGWSYYWNATKPLVFEAAPGFFMMDLSALVPLTPSGASYVASGTNVSATGTTLVPGQGSGQGDGIERFVIAAYTIQPGDVAANGNQLILDGYSFEVPKSSADGVTAKVFRNDIQYISRDLAPELIFNVDTPAPNGGPIPLGQFDVGDEFYVAIGSNGTAPAGTGTDTGDVLSVDYTIVLVPEPASLGVCAGLGSLMLLRRRRAQAASR